MAVAVIPAGSAAQSLSEIERRGEAIAAERRRALASGSPSVATREAWIERLGGLVLAFVDQSDRAARAGRGGGRSLREAFEALHEPLDGIYQTHNRSLERMARAVMDVDGDLEALYETQDWKEAQVVAAKSLYYLNWLNYYGARLFEGERREKLLDAAVQGFSEFAVGDRRPDLIGESLLGRALSHLEKGDYDWAIRDFNVVLKQTGVSGERRAKARLGLLDTYVRSGRHPDALRYSAELLDQGLSSGDAALVRFMRLQVLLVEAKRSSGATAERYRSQASQVMGQLRRAGSGWRERVDDLLASQIDDPTEWVGKANSPASRWQVATMLMQQADHTRAAPLLEAILADDSTDARRFHAEARYLLGVARFQQGEHARAAELLDAALEQGGIPSYADEARYLRFKALESMMAAQGGEDIARRYTEAIEDFLAKSPAHPSVPEAQFRRGELFQSEGRFSDAVAAYAEVSGDPDFAVRAAFGSLQSYFEMLRATTSPERREELLEQIEAGVAEFRERADALENSKTETEIPLPERRATVTFFEAVALSLREGREEDIARTLADFDERFPEGRALLPQVLRLRLAALGRLRRMDEALALVEEHAEVLREDAGGGHLEGLALTFTKDGARLRQQGETVPAEKAERIAARLFELMPGEMSLRTRLRLAKLYESLDKTEKARDIYQAILDENESSLAALRGMAELAERDGGKNAAQGLWKRYTKITRAGDRSWYEGHYQQARLALATGNADECCDILDRLRSAMPGLSDQELRADLSALWDRACE